MNDIAGNGKNAPVLLVVGKDTDLGEKSGWHCYAKVDRSETNRDTATMRCESGTLMVRTRVESSPGETSPAVPLQISDPSGGKVARTLLIGTR